MSLKHEMFIRKIAGEGLFTRLKNFVAYPYRANVNRVTATKPKGELSGSAADYDAAAGRLYNMYTPDQRLEFSQAKDPRAPHVRYSLEKEFGDAWSDSRRPMCNAVVRNVLNHATGSDILLNRETGRTMTVAELNRIAKSKNPIINGFRLVPMTWNEAKNHSGALVISPKHMGFRVRFGGKWHTFNASSSKGLTYNSQWGDPEDQSTKSSTTRDGVAPDFYRFERLPDSPTEVLNK